MATVSRLIDYFIPEHYQLSLELNRTGRNFRGTVTISGVLQPEAPGVFLHAKGLVIESALIDGKLASFAHGENDEVSLTQDDLQPGKHLIVVGFSGPITDAMNGIYPCYYEHAGVKKELLATQFESHHAREAFPCIDEPEAKATFDLVLTTDEDVTALSNMPVVSRDSDGRQMVTTFGRTPRMSTYLLAFVVGELQARTARTKNDVEVAVWATPAQAPESLDYALEAAVSTLEFFEDYFDRPYPLPKCDHVALPDFAAGAMENWGLITYREAALLVDPVTGSLSTRQYIVRIVAHEVSHQWFGNLVTMKWWNTLWLNESFATLMMYLAPQAIHPEWDCWLDFSTSQSAMALERDSIDGVQSVQVDVHHPDEINTLFDPWIVYAKGARLLRMLQLYIGEEAFQKGLQQYFKQHAYTNTEGDDLWRALAEASGEDIVGLMNAWITQPGYPVVHVRRDGDDIILEQEQLFVGPHQPSDQLWPIPLDSTAPEAPALFDQQTTRFAMHGSSLRLNQVDGVHFVTHYDAELLEAIIGDLKRGDLPTVARLQLLTQSIILARSGVISSAELIPLIDAYSNETSEYVWRVVASALAELRKFVESDEVAQRAHRQLAVRIARRQCERLGWEPKADEPEADTALRTIVVGLMLYGEDEQALAKARELYASTPLEALNPDLRQAILKAVVRHGDGEIVDELLAKHQEVVSADLKIDISFGITATRVPEKLSMLLELLRDSSVVRPQDVRRWYMLLLRNRSSHIMTWQWIRDNWQWIITTFEGGKYYDDFPRFTANGLSTRQELDEFKTFFEPMIEIPALSRVISMGISEIEGRVELIERDGDAVRTALLHTS